MALNLGIPTNEPILKILDFIPNLKAILTRLIINDDLNFNLDEISSNNMIGKDLIIKNGTKIIFKRYGTELTIFYDVTESIFDYKDQSYKANWFSIDVSGFRSPLGYLMVAAISIMISDRTMGFIEDPTCFWTSSEVSTTKDFISQVSIENSTSNIEEACFENFYKNLYSNS